MTIAEWFTGFFPSFEGVVEVTVRKVDQDTGATVTQSTGVRAYKKGGSGDELGTVRAATCQWRLIKGDISFEPEPLHQVIEADGTKWQIKPKTKVTSEVFGRYRVCQCAEIVAGS